MTRILLLIALTAALLWFLRRLLRSPRDLALRAVTACLGLMVAVELLGRGAAAASMDTVGHHGIYKLTENLVLLAAYWCLMLFFLFSAEGVQARRRAWWETPPLLISMALLTVSMIATPDSLRDHMFSTGDMRVTGIAGFHFVAEVYCCYLLCLTAWWAWQYATESGRWMRLGLRIAALGLGIRALDSAARAGFVVHRSNGGIVPPSVNSTALILMNIGGILFVAGVLIPGVVTGASTVRVLFRHRRVFHDLAPLWERLHAVFPEDALDRTPQTSWWNRLSPRRVHRHYWRRVIEIRDGLVKLSPHLADLGYSRQQPMVEQIGLLRRALQRQRDGVSATSSTAVLVAAPHHTNLDVRAEVEQLVCLAHELTTAEDGDEAMAL